MLRREDCRVGTQVQTSVLALMNCAGNPFNFSKS